MKVLVIGGGGREHAIVHALSKSSKVTEIYAAPGNAGIAKLAMCVNIKDTDVDNTNKIYFNQFLKIMAKRIKNKKI